MVIAVDIRFAEKKGPLGDDWALHHFWQMARTYPQHHFVFINNQTWLPHQFRETNIETVKAGPAAHRYRLLQYWYNFRLPALLRKYKADVFVSLGNHASLYAKIPQCLLVNELPHNHPEWASKNEVVYYKSNQERFFNKAAGIFATSQFCADAIIAAFPEVANKVQVLYPGVADIFTPTSYERQEAAREQYTEGTAYFLYSGNLLPQNNLMNLLKAFSQFKKMQKSSMKLLLAGHNLWPKNELAQSLRSYKYRKDVVLTGYLTPDALAHLTAAAYALVLPAELPGFALPPLEAMQCGVPPIVTATGALPEICGPAALYAADGSVKELANQMMLVFKDEAVRSEKIKAGLQQVITYEEHKSLQRLEEAIKTIAEKGLLT